MTATDITADINLCAADGPAKEFVGDVTEFMKKTGATDADLISYSAKRAHIANNTLLGFLSDLGSHSKTACLPVVQMMKEDQKSGGEGGGGSGGGSESGGSGEGSGGEQKQESSGMIVERLALYGRDGRVGVLEKESARGIAWTCDVSEKGLIVANVNFDGETVEAVSGRLLKKCAEVKICPKSNKATVVVKTTIEPRGDKFNKLDSKNDKAASDAVRNGFAEVIKNELTSAYEDGKSLGLDPFFIGTQFYRFAPDYAEVVDMNEVAVDFEVHVLLK